MEKLSIRISIILLILFSINSYSQNFDTRKYIEVTGSAEMSIQPDEIELEIILVEYDKEGKKINLDKVNSDFNDVLIKNGIDIKTLTLISSSNYWWYWWSNRKESYQTKTINLKLNKETNFLKLVEDLNKKWVQNISIAKSTNKEIYKFRKEVKIEAIKAAKEKASYLLESVGEQIGGVISIQEIPEENNYWYNRNNMLSNSNISVSSRNSDAVENVAEIKLRYEIKVKFEIK
jgi:uncharacterized protein